MDRMKIEVDQIWKRKKDGVYIIVVDTSQPRRVVLRRADGTKRWSIEDWGLRRKYFLPQSELCRACACGEPEHPSTPACEYTKELRANA